MKKQLLFCFLCSNLLVAHPCFAALDLELTRGLGHALPLAIVPFANEGNDEETSLTAVIKHDLRGTGRFKLLPKANMPTQPQSASSVNPTVWHQAGVDAVAVGTLSPMDTQHSTLHFALVDVLKNKSTILLDKSFNNVAQKDQRRLAHHLSDLIYEALLGESGGFSSRIAYVVARHPGDSHTRYLLEVADADGFNPRTLLSSAQPIMSPSWSHDGRRIAYVSFENQQAQIDIIDVATGQRHLVSRFAGINGAPAWSPNDQQLALVLSKSGSPKIYTLDIATQSLKPITQGTGIDTEPNWHPNGKFILFTSDRGGSPQLYQVNLATKQVERITYEGKYNARGAFSADGKQIVMIHGDGNGYTIGIQEISNGVLTNLTHSGNEASPSFSPNGNRVLYETRLDGKHVLGLISSDGGVKQTLPTPEGDAQDPAWSPK